METPSPYTEFGQKGVGEGGAIGPAAAIANAVNDALHKLGVEICEIPITPRRILEAIAKASQQRAIVMKPVAFDYERPTTLADAAMLLGQANGFSKVLAGGQSLGPMLNLRLAQPELLVDITSIPELTAVNDSRRSSRRSAPASPTPTSKTAAFPIISAGCCSTSPAASPIARCATAARSAAASRMPIRPPTGFRRFRCIGAEAIDLPRRGETAPSRWPTWCCRRSPRCVSRTRSSARSAIPKLSAGARWGFYKFSQKAGEFAHAIGGVLHDPARGRVSRRDRRHRDGADRGCRRERAVRRQASGPTLPNVSTSRPCCNFSTEEREGRRTSDSLALVALKRAAKQACRAVKALSLAINGRNVKAEVEPRLNLADFLREHQVADGDACRLRAWRLRRLHGADRRRARAVLHHLRGCRRPRRDHDAGRASRTIRSWTCCARPSPSIMACSAASARPAC